MRCRESLQQVTLCSIIQIKQYLTRHQIRTKIITFLAEDMNFLFDTDLLNQMVWCYL
jgi:hypothetical protein